MNEDLFEKYELGDKNFNKLIVCEENISKKNEKKNIEEFIKRFKEELQEKLTSNHHELIDKFLDKKKGKKPFVVNLSDFLKIDKTISYKSNITEDTKTIKCIYCIGINWSTITKYDKTFRNYFKWNEHNFGNTYSLYFLSNKDFDRFYLIDDNQKDIGNFVENSDNIFDVYHNKGEPFYDLCDKIVQYITNSLV